jgi:V/A-type H+-transporting ATPase subunit I
MIAGMKKIEIMGEKDLLDEALIKLQDLGFVHLEEPPSLEGGRLSPTRLTDEEEKEKSFLRLALQDLSEIERGLNIKAEAEVPESLTLNKVRDRTEKLKEEYTDIIGEERSVRDEIRALSDYKNILKAVLPLVEEKGEEEAAFIGITIPKSEVRILDLLGEILEEKLGEPIEILRSEMRGERIAALLVVDKEKEEIARKIIWEEGLTELRLPDKYSGLTLKETLEAIERDLSLLPDTLNSILEKKRIFGEKIAREIVSLKKWILTRLDFLGAKENFTASSRYVFLIRAWIPVEYLGKLEEYLKRNFGEAVFIVNQKPHKGEYKRVPVLLKNPKFLKPFELLLSIFQPPVYGTVDPTPFLYIFFPIYFGFMLGDVGYGGVGFFLFSFLYRASKPGSTLRSVASLFLWTMFWSIVFGVLYGEAFGDLGEHLGMRPLLIHRTHNIMPILIASIAFGVIQVLLGILLGVYNNFKIGHKKHALFEIFRFSGLIGLLLVVLGSVGVLSKGVTLPGAIIFGASAVIVLFIHGIAAPLEILSAAGNMLSFARLMAIGLSSAILGSIANQLGGMMGIIVFTLIVSLIFHTLNMILGIFDPSVQGLRLQFVEFFSKFYITGGRPYKPFERGGGRYAA